MMRHVAISLRQARRWAKTFAGKRAAWKRLQLTGANRRGSSGNRFFRQPRIEIKKKLQTRLSLVLVIAIRPNEKLGKNRIERRMSSE